MLLNGSDQYAEARVVAMSNIDWHRSAVLNGAQPFLSRIWLPHQTLNTSLLDMKTTSTSPYLSAFPTHLTGEIPGQLLLELLQDIICGLHRVSS